MTFRRLLFFRFALTLLAVGPASAADPAIAMRKVNPTTVEVELAGDRSMTLDFFAADIVRWFRDDEGGEVRDPESDPEADILVEEPRTEVGELQLEEGDGKLIVRSAQIAVEIGKADGLLKVIDIRRRRGRSLKCGVRTTRPFPCAPSGLGFLGGKRPRGEPRGYGPTSRWD